MNYLTYFLEDYATTMETDFFTSKIKGGASSTLAQSKISRLAMLSEPSHDGDFEMKLNNSLI